MKTILDSAHTWFLDSVIFKDGNLALLVIEGMRAEEPEEIIVSGTSLGEGSRVSSTTASRRVRLRFENVVAYQVVDESYVEYDKSEKQESGFVGLVERSRYKDMIQQRYPLLEIMRTECRHYCLWTEDAVVDVVADRDPHVEEDREAVGRISRRRNPPL